MLFENLFNKIKNFFYYWYQKKEEIKYLKIRDLNCAKIISQIELFYSKKEKKFIKLKNIKKFHSIDRKSAKKKLKERIKKIKKLKRKNIKKFSIKELNEIMHSITNMKVIKWDNYYIIWEGNGRLEALKKVFGQDLEIEVEEYIIENETGKKIINNLLLDLYKK